MSSLNDACVCIDASRDRVIDMVRSLPLSSPPDAGSEYGHARIPLLMATIGFMEYNATNSAPRDV